jgi:hypothetical protein
MPMRPGDLAAASDGEIIDVLKVFMAAAAV